MSHLREALETLREYGMAKNHLYDDQHGTCCANGALNIAAHGDCHYLWEGHALDTAEDLKLLAQIIKEQYPDMHDSGISSLTVLLFNDHPDVGQEDLERVFEKAILLYEETLGV